jgi:hypothetical protein
MPSLIMTYVTFERGQNRPSYNYEQLIHFETKLDLLHLANDLSLIFISDLDDEKNGFQSMK